MLVTQLEDVTAEADGARLDADLFAQMSPDEAALVQAALGEDVGADVDEEAAPDDDFGFPLDFDDVSADPGRAEENGIEVEIARLKEELESSRRVQAAFERYLDLLSG